MVVCATMPETTLHEIIDRVYYKLFSRRRWMSAEYNGVEDVEFRSVCRFMHVARALLVMHRAIN